MVVISSRSRLRLLCIVFVFVDNTGAIVGAVLGSVGSVLVVICSGGIVLVVIKGMVVFVDPS